MATKTTKKTYSQSRRRKGNRFEEDKKSFDKSKDVKSSGRHFTSENDPSWYTHNEQLVLDAGRLSFNVPTGSPIHLDIPNDGANVTNKINGLTTYKMPGVCAFWFTPTFGMTNEANDPLNIAARNVYSNVRYKNSGAKNYDPNDLMLYLLAMDNIYMMYQTMCRMYGVTRVFSQLNRHYPRTIAKALRFDYDDFLDNLSNIRAYLNTVSAKIGSLCVPARFPLFKRHMWMCSGIYQDAPTPKSQLYVFTPWILGKYSEKTSESGGSLVPVQLPNDATFAQLKSIMDTMLNAVVSSEDCGIMSGDIRKAYDQGGLMEIMGIGDEYVVIPEYVEEVLRQIQNITVFNGIVGYDTGLMVYQDLNDNILKSGVKLTCATPFYAGNHILTGSDATPSPEEVLVNSRLMVGGTVTPRSPQSGQEYYDFTPIAVGSEVVIAMAIYPDENTVITDLSYSARTNESFGAWITFTEHYAQLETFNYHPRVGLIHVDGASHADYISNQDVDNYAIIGNSVLYNLHQTSILSLFDVPAFGV